MAARLFITFLILSATFSLLTPSLAKNILYSGEYLSGGQELTEGSLSLVLQTDCNLVLYDRGMPIWKSWTYGENCFLVMQYDGNLAIYSVTGPLWYSNNQQAQEGNYVAVLQRDRKVVIYGPALWTTGTINQVGTVNVTISSNSTDEPVVIARDKISMVTDTGK